MTTAGGCHGYTSDSIPWAATERRMILYFDCMEWASGVGAMGIPFGCCKWKECVGVEWECGVREGVGEECVRQ